MSNPIKTESDIWDQHIVETESLRMIREAVADGVSALFVTGAPGMGKTTLLRLLERDWLRNGGRVCFGSLRAIHGESDLLRIFQEQLDGTLRQSQTLVVESSADDVAQSLVALVNSQDRRVLILLDGLDEALNARPILRAARLLLEQTRATVVLTGRPGSFEREFEHLPFRLVALAPLNNAEVAALLARSSLGPDAVSSVQRVYETAGGHPLLTNLIATELAEHSDREFRDLILSPAASLGVFVRRLLTRESHSQGVDYKSLVIPLARLAIRGSAARRDDLGLTARELELLSTSSLIRRDGEVLVLAHPAVAPEILVAAGVLPPPETRLKDLEFGAEEAERDSLLAESFIDPPGVEELRSGRKNIVVGDRGAGKSALFAALSRMPPSQRRGIQVLTLEDPAELMLRLESKGEKLVSAEQFRAAWLLSLACSLATQLDLESPRQRRMAARLRAALPGATPDRSVTGRLVSIWNKLRRTSVKFQLGPIVLEPAKATDTAERGGRAIDVAAFLQETALALRSVGRQIFVAVDRIDEVHKYSRDLQEHLVQGLFLAEGSLSRTPEVHLLIFVRTDLFEMYDIQEKNKLVSRTLRLRWSRDDLLHLVIRRILANQSLAGLAEFVKGSLDNFLGDALRILFPALIEGEPFTEWLWRCLENGNGDVSPRQLILLLILVREIPGASDYSFKSIPIFREETLRQAMTQLSELSFSETINDFRVAKTFLRSCRAGKLDLFQLGEIEQLFDKSEGSTGLQVELLERLGVLERIVTQDHLGQRIAKFRIPSLYTRCWTATPS